MTLNLALRLGAITPAASGISAPTDIANCALWLDASVAGDFTYSSGVVVSQWNDKSGNARHATPPFAGPSRNGTINSLTTCVFDGSTTYLNCASGTNVVTSGPWTAFAVVKASSVSGVRSPVDHDASGRRVAQIMRNNGATQESIAFNTGVSAFTDTNAGSVSTGTAYVYTARADTTTIETWRDGSSNGSTAVTGTLQTSNGSSVLAIGRSAQGSQYWSGDIAEVVIYNAALSTTDRQSVEAYLKAKWGTA